MKVEFLKRFSKDIDELAVKSVKTALKKLIESIENADTLIEIPNTKKLQGHKSAYRIRVGNYRLGFFYENETHPALGRGPDMNRTRASTN